MWMTSGALGGTANRWSDAHEPGTAGFSYDAVFKRDVTQDADGCITIFREIFYFA